MVIVSITGPYVLMQSCIYDNLRTRGNCGKIFSPQLLFFKKKRIFLKKMFNIKYNNYGKS